MVLFESPRLVTRYYTAADTDNFFLLNGNEQVVRYIRPVATKEASDEFLQSNIDYYAKHPNLGRFAVDEKSTCSFVGSVAIIPVDGHSDELQIGYSFIPAVWGKGFATEITRAGIDFFFTHHAADKLFAIAEEPNVPSQKVLLKCGFTQIETLLEGEKSLLKYCLRRNKQK